MENFCPFKSFDTMCLHSDLSFESSSLPPYGIIGQGNKEQCQYRISAEKCLADLDNGNFCSIFPSGMAVTGAVIHLVQHGDHIITIDDLYQGVNRYFVGVAAQFGIEKTPVDLTDFVATAAAFKPNTKLVWIETPTNPLMNLVDIEKVSNLAHSINPEIIVVVENTFASAYYQRPLELGADISLYSLSKYMNGHSDVIMGAAVTRSPSLHDRLTSFRSITGCFPSSFDCYLMRLSLKTLAVRMREHMRTGLAIARFLEGHSSIEKVIHPGLQSHPQHDLSKRQMRGYPGMVTVYIKGGSRETTMFVTSLKLFTLAESFGGFESLVEIPSHMTHSKVAAGELKHSFSDNMVRLSAGLEEPKDLLHDIDQALQCVIDSQMA